MSSGETRRATFDVAPQTNWMNHPEDLFDFYRFKGHASGQTAMRDALPGGKRLTFGPDGNHRNIVIAPGIQRRRNECIRGIVRMSGKEVENLGVRQ